MFRSPVEDLAIEGEKLSGIYRGVVEDNNDPDKAGRVRVRVFGLYSPERNKGLLEGIPVNELPWAEPCMPIVEGSVSGFGIWSVPVQGCHVMVFFENGNPTQLRYFATVPGIPEEQPDKDEGFSDPDGEYPTSWRLGEPDVHRLARGGSDDTLVTTKNNNRTLGVPIALDGDWNEPTSPYDAEYPHNMVTATHGGITSEFDSTPGKERLHFYHPSNSYIEIDADGNMVVKNNATRYDITLNNRNEYIKVSRTLTVDEDNRVMVKGDAILETQGDQFNQIGGDITTTAEGSINTIATLNITITASGEITIIAPDITLLGNVHINP